MQYKENPMLDNNNQSTSNTSKYQSHKSIQQVVLSSFHTLFSFLNLYELDSFSCSSKNHYRLTGVFMRSPLFKRHRSKCLSDDRQQWEKHYLNSHNRTVYPRLNIEPLLFFYKNSRKIDSDSARIHQKLETEKELQEQVYKEWQTTMTLKNS